ncbi:MAG: hypothetical protein IT264_00070 [Saprospiraceae bacterium]|nr:hypothetical protein [Saprospiraceae bacterium]
MATNYVVTLTKNGKEEIHNVQSLEEIDFKDYSLGNIRIMVSQDFLVSEGKKFNKRVDEKIARLLEIVR